MNALVALCLVLPALAATAVVLTRDPERQAVTLSVLGMLLCLLLLVLQAPDVALSELGIGTAIVPLMVMLTIRTIDKDRRTRKSGKGTDKDGDS